MSTQIHTPKTSPIGLSNVGNGNLNTYNVLQLRTTEVKVRKVIKELTLEYNAHVKRVRYLARELQRYRTLLDKIVSAREQKVR